MSFEEFLSWLASQKMALRWLEEHCEYTKLTAIRAGPDLPSSGWSVRIKERFKTRERPRSADGYGLSLAAAFEDCIYNFNHPYIYTPKPRAPALELDLDIGDLEL